MTQQRANDPQPARHYRSERINLVNGQFFFATREGTLEGPFFSRREALEGIELYIQCMRHLGKIMGSSKIIPH